MTMKIGHRGVGGYVTENSLESFEKALKYDVDMVEFDVSVCKTGEVVVIHDFRVDRTTNGKGYVRDKTLQELRELDLANGQKIPTLQEVLDVIDKKVKVNIELKGEGAATVVSRIVNDYRSQKGWDNSDFLVSSFNHYELLEFTKLSPDINIGAVIAGIPIGYAQGSQKVNPYSLHPSKEFINQELVRSAHDLGMKVFVYTVNEPEDIDRVKSLGVDGVFSDFPDRI